MPEVTRGGVHLHYSDNSTGPAVLFHTGAAGDGRMWEPAGYPDIISPCRQLFLDHRGHGQSDRPTEALAHRLDEYVADVVAVLDHVQVDRVILVGYSAGAKVVYSLAADHPDRVIALACLGGVD
ncbi:MAG: alpha/beta fold hydrolase [Candidatus Dormibacteria bacterium]